MPTLAILDDVIPMQLRERPDELAPIELVWSGVDLERLRAEAPRLRPDVIALDLQRLGPDPVTEARALAEACGAQLLIVLYAFAPRETLREVLRAGARAIKTPVRLGALRAQMTSVIVRGILGGDAAPMPGGAAREAAKGASSAPAADTSAPAARSTPALAETLPEPPPRRYTRAQLGRLAEIQSSVDCECPNHLSELLLGLTAFEDYSAECENRDAADAAVHAALHRATAHARAIMEEALARLLVHEKLAL
jgi:DNA-binding NarL/FixJ family response regulator